MGRFLEIVGLGSLVAAVACGDNEKPYCVPPDQCGIVCDEATVVFQDGTTPERIEAINAEIGATVLRAPLLSSAYLVQLPEGLGFEAASDFYKSKSDVVSVLWALNFCPF